MASTGASRAWARGLHRLPLNALRVLEVPRLSYRQSFAVDAQHPERGVSWSDAAGRHPVVVGAGQVQQLPAGQELNAAVTWWVESLDAADQDSTVVAALSPTTPSAPCDVQAITHTAEQSGRITVLANTRGRW